MPNPYLRAALREQAERRKAATKTSATEVVEEKAEKSAPKSAETKPSKES